MGDGSGGNQQDIKLIKLTGSQGTQGTQGIKGDVGTVVHPSTGKVKEHKGPKVMLNHE